MDDAALIARVRAGDREAFGCLFDRYRDHAYAMAVARVRDPQAALDVTQDAFLKALTRIDQLREPARFASWLARIVEHAANDHHRRRRRLHPLDEAAETLTATETGPDAQIDRSRVRRALEALGPRLRLPLVLRYDGGYSYEQIARALGVSTGTVASRLSRAHRRLAVALAAFARSES